ncbi:phosphatidate cytidylyltransferase [Thermodesulfobacteriota bacterium]
MAPSSHIKRWLTAIVALPPLVWILFERSGVFFLALVAAVSSVAIWEYFGVFLPQDRKRAILRRLTAIIAGLCVIGGSWRYGERALFPVLFATVVVFSVFSLVLFVGEKSDYDNVSREILCILYIPALLSSLVLLRRGQDGIVWVVFTIALVFAADTGAYYAGSYLGRRKLHPRISPGKTVEGAIGGIAADIAVGAFFKWHFFTTLSWPVCVLLCVCAAVVGQAGDLFESLLKRSAGVKDSGSLLPGHGGILDRIDALLFTAPLVYWFKLIMEG